MLALIAAAAAQTMQPSGSTDPDMACTASLLFVIGQMDEDPKATSQSKAEVTSLLMYFYGKLDGRKPGYNIKGELEKLTAKSDSFMRDLKPVTDRCLAEVQSRATYLESFGSAGSPAK